MDETQKELPNFPFPFFTGSWMELEDTKLENKLPLELFLKHEGYRITFGREKCVLSIFDSPEYPRDVLRLDITTHRGLSLGAIHFYGHIMFPYVGFVNEGEKLFWNKHDLPCCIKLHRPLTKKELLEDAERADERKRYVGYKAGDMTDGFNTPTELVRRAEFVVEKYFPGFRMIVSE